MKNLILVTDQPEVLEFHMWNTQLPKNLLRIGYFFGLIMLLFAFYYLLNFLIAGTPLDDKPGKFSFVLGFSLVSFFFTWLSIRYTSIPFILKLDMANNEIISSGMLFKLKKYHWKLSEVTSFDIYSVYVKKWPSESELIKKQNESFQFKIKFRFTNPNDLLIFAEFFMKYQEWDVVRKKIVSFFTTNGFTVSDAEIGTEFNISRKN